MASGVDALSCSQNGYWGLIVMPPTISINAKRPSKSAWA